MARGSVTNQRTGRSRTRPGLNLNQINSAAVGGEGRLDFASLLPQRPLEDESRVDDWSFEIQWTVVLIRPEAARLAEENRSAAGGAAIDGGAMNGTVSSGGLDPWGWPSSDAMEDPS